MMFFHVPLTYMYMICTVLDSTRYAALVLCGFAKVAETIKIQIFGQRCTTGDGLEEF